MTPKIGAMSLVGYTLCIIFFGAFVTWTGVETRSKPDLYKMQFLYRNVRDIECNVNCTNVKYRPICGTDGKTYPHKCEIRRIRRCEGRLVSVLSKGRCRGTVRSGLSSSKCLEERAQARELAKRPSTGVYIPECKADGTFAEVQCHAATGYCWCVTGDGKPIPGSSVKGKKLNCRGTKGCSPTDRSTFNGNLIQHFSVEYDRIPKPTQPSYPGAPKDLPIKSESDSLLDTPEKRVIEWKFSELDTNKDEKLRRKELRSLKRMVKRIVPPKACAKSFDKYCDLDQDGGIARNEWSVCLGVDINNEQPTTPTPEANIGGGIPLHTYDVISASHLLRSSADAVDDEGKGPSLWDKQTSIRLNGKGRGGSSGNRRDRQNEMPSKRDCDEERRAAEEMDRKDPEGRIFIPECEEEGRYKKEQCHKSTGYCWCVDETSGKPIPGTSTHNEMPDCSAARSRMFDDDAFLGCPYSRKKRFLTELLDRMTAEMMEYAQNASRKEDVPEPNPDHTLEEQVVRWKLLMLDKNNNEVLERREWKKFKREIRKKKSLKRCGRRFLTYCDVDENSEITMEEWIECMGLNEQPRNNLPVNPKRKGPNPFSKYLRS